MDRFEEVKLKIKEGVDLVALVEEYVHLKARGRYHMGLCPFHQEKTPSFSVHSDGQYFRCFGCGKAGDVFTFLMERDGVSFREAVEILAERIGVSTEGAFGGGRRDGRPREDFNATLGKVRDWFRYVLQTGEGAPARAYLEGRGLGPAIEPFGLGFHPAGGLLREFVEKEGLSRRVLEQAGLLTGDGYERFTGRVMFPIEDERGRVVGFGGRILASDTEKVKYLNSPEAPFFNKRKLLFGLRHAKRANDRALVVMEGYTDVIAAHLAGMTGAVATLGTALTTDHARLLERFATDGVVLLFDGDRAGRQAADGAFRELVHTALPVRIALLGEGEDPADLVAAIPGRSEEDVAEGRRRLAALVADADDALTVWFRLLRQRVDLTLDANVERVSRECGRIVASVTDSVRREALARRMAQHLGLPERVFLQAVSQAEKRARRPARAPAPAVEAAGDGEEAVDYAFEAGAWDAASPRRPAEPPGPEAVSCSPQLAEADQDLLACLLSCPELLGQEEGVDVTLPAVRDILDLFREGVSKGSGTRDQIVRYLFMKCAERPDLSQLVASCLDRAEHIKSPQDTFSLLLKDRSAHATRHAAQHIRYRLQLARDRGDEAEVRKLTQEYLEQLRSRSTGSA